MRIFITGATGFIGAHLCCRLEAAGHTVVAWVRSVERARSSLGVAAELVDASGGKAALSAAVDGADAIINLAGEPVLGRWSEERKRRMVTSRVDLTRDLVAAIEAASVRPKVFISGSAVGYYGARGDEPLTETSTPGEGYLADLCQLWEAAAMPAEELGVRLAIIRIGIVLGSDGGALEAMVKPARFGLGGALGSGDQYTPWIHIDDLVELMVTILGDERYSGVFNGTAPAPVTNSALTREIGGALGRPTFLRVPSFALKVALGEASSALLTGQRALPEQALSLGFSFRFDQVRDALADLLR